MKHLKMYEEHDLFSQSKFNVGDIVKTIDNIGIFDIPLKPGTNYFKISEIVADNDDYKYLIHNLIIPDYMEYYERDENLEIVPDYEFAGINYNL